MKMDDILRQLEASIADERLSDAEKQTLASLLREVSPPEEGLRRLRNAAFDLVRQRLAAPLPSIRPEPPKAGAGSQPASAGSTPGSSATGEPYNLLKWLEGVVRCIDTSRKPPSPTHSVAYFSPGTACRAAIIQRMDLARSKIDICVFTISDDRITEAIRKAHRRGVALRLITDDFKAGDIGSDIDQLRQEGVPVAEDAPEGHMHHKFALFDGAWLITGSYNWTRSAATVNDENLVETNDPTLLRQFGTQFETLWTRYGSAQNPPAGSPGRKGRPSS